MERLNQIKQPEIIRMPWVESKYIDDESRFERLVFKQKKDRFDIQLSQREDGLWFWAVSCHTDNAGFCYGLFEGCGTYAKERQDAINAAVLEIADWAIRNNNKLSSNGIEWMLEVTQSLVEQEELF